MHQLLFYPVENHFCFAHNQISYLDTLGPGPLALFFGLGPGSRAQCVQITYLIMSKTEMVFYGVKQKLVHLFYI